MFPYADQLNLAGWLHIVYFGAILPLFAFRQRKQLIGTGQALPDRLRHFQRTAFTIVMLTTLWLAVAQVQEISLFPRSLPAPSALAAGVAMYVAAVAFMRPRWRGAVARRARVVHLFMPANAVERIWWVTVSIFAGIGEEITWRGVQAALVYVLTGNFWLSALLCSLSFALTHVVQGWRSVSIIVLFALGFHALVWLGESLYAAMAVHVAYVITAGISYGKLGRELGFLEDSRLRSTASVSR